MLSPVYCMAATGPMTIPSITDTQWQPLEVGVIWGLKHGTSWLMTPLQAPESMQRQPLVLQFVRWATSYVDAPGLYRRSFALWWLDAAPALHGELATLSLDAHSPGSICYTERG